MANSLGQLSLILGHMQRHQAEGRSAPVVLDPPFALAELLTDVLRRLAGEHAIADIVTAAQVLESATGIISDDCSSSISTVFGIRTSAPTFDEFHRMRQGRVGRNVVATMFL
jgi:hypothetical protein